MWTWQEMRRSRGITKGYALKWLREATKGELEAIADECKTEKDKLLFADFLLQANNCVGKRQGVFTTRQFEEQFDQTRCTPLSEFEPDTVPTKDPCESLEDIAWNEIESGARYLKINDADMHYLQLRRDGFSYADIETICQNTCYQLTKKRISLRLKRASTRIFNAYPYMGLYDIIAEACGVSPSYAKEICRKK
jgi:hypothetical protein